MLNINKPQKLIPRINQENRLLKTNHTRSTWWKESHTWIYNLPEVKKENKQTFVSTYVLFSNK